jgi:hypothetical protein
MQKMRCLIALSDISQRVNVEVFSYCDLLRKPAQKTGRTVTDLSYLILFIEITIEQKDERGFYS